MCSQETNDELCGLCRVIDGRAEAGRVDWNGTWSSLLRPSITQRVLQATVSGRSPGGTNRSRCSVAEWRWTALSHRFHCLALVTQRW